MKMNEGHTVVVIMEGIKGKEDALKNVLMSVVEPSRSESSCLEYRLHQDKNNPAQFILYENWESEQLHQEQFKKSYIIASIEKIEPLLAKPYQVIFANEIS
ncbi:TPA: antibiotic biosynthesis monooxygenase [Legionella pneumophila]|nr:antibiotic biosynthesis monooxygenase [Legionella pneumophila]HEL3599864.1 antibiotic biosynthesis monooxygenase [Legionella pneumophila]HEL7844223.1 antibiotic biosynthesis monooxygenase [Legionella pneumophila]